MQTTGGPLGNGFLMDKSQPQKVGRLLSAAQQIARMTNNPEIGGSSADLNSMRLYQPGDDYHMVGGTPDKRTGKAFPSQLVDVGSPSPHMTVHDVLSTRERMLPASRGGCSPGLWDVERLRQQADRGGLLNCF